MTTSIAGERPVDVDKVLEQSSEKINGVLEIMRPGYLSDGVHAEHTAAYVDCSHPDLGQHGTHG